MAFEHVLIGVYGFQLGQSQALFSYFYKLSIHPTRREGKDKQSDYNYCLYDVERTLCDIVKGNNTCDIRVVNQAMKQFANMPGKNIPKLFGYAGKVRVKFKILNYMEDLL